MTALDIAMLIALSAIWGASYLFIRVAGPAFGPFALIDVRVWLAGSALVPVALAARQMPDLRARWRDYLLLGAINAAIPFTLITISVGNLNASISSILRTSNSTSFAFQIAAAASLGMTPSSAWASAAWASISNQMRNRVAGSQIDTIAGRE